MFMKIRYALICISSTLITAASWANEIWDTEQYLVLSVEVLSVRAITDNHGTQLLDENHELLEALLKETDKQQASLPYNRFNDNALTSNLAKTPATYSHTVVTFWCSNASKTTKETFYLAMHNTKAGCFEITLKINYSKIQLSEFTPNRRAENGLA